MSEEYTGLRGCDYCQDKKNYPCSDKGCNIANNYVAFKPELTKPEKHSIDLKSKWTNGEWTISWLDQDMICIEGPYTQTCTMAAGDFESMLSALCAAFNEGKG